MLRHTLDVAHKEQRTNNTYRETYRHDNTHPGIGHTWDRVSIEISKLQKTLDNEQHKGDEAAYPQGAETRLVDKM